MFEQRILCHELTSSFNSITINNNEEQCVIKRNKILQDLKHQMLNVELEHYELKIQHYEHLHEQELNTFRSEVYKTESSYQICHLNEFNAFCKNLCILTYKTFDASNSLQRILFSCHITKPSSSSLSVSCIKQSYRCLSANNCRHSKSFVESDSIGLSFTDW